MSRRRRPRKRRGGTSVSRSDGTDLVSIAKTLATLAVGILFIVMPVIVFPRAADAFGLPKRIVAEWLGLLSVVCLSGVAWGRTASELAATARRLPAVVAIAPFLLVASVSWLTTDHPDQAGQALTSVFIAASCLVAWSAGLGRYRLRRLLRVLALPATVLGAVGLLQAVGAFQPFEFSSGAHTERLQVTSLAGNSGDLAMFMIVPVLLGLEEGWRRARWSRWAWLTGAALWGTAAVATRAMGPVIALGLAVAVWALLRLPRRTVALGFGGLAVVALVALAGPLSERVEQKIRASSRGDLNALMSGRLDGWRVAWSLTTQHPITGVGLGGYRAEFAPTRLALMDEGVRFFRGHRYPVFGHAHNELLEVGADLGWPGIATLLWAVFALARRLRTRPDGEGEEIRGPPSDHAFYVAALVGIGFCSFVLFPFRLAIVGYPTLLLVATIFADEESST